MSAPLDTDPRQAAAHLAMAEHLTGPLAGGARTRVLAVDGNGVVTVPDGTRKPLLLLAPAAPLLERGVRVAATPAGDSRPVVLQFAPFTEAAAYLPVLRPPADPGTGVAPAVTVSVRAWWLDETGQTTLIDTPQLGGLLQGGLVEGDLGALLYVLGSEHARLRRQARAIAAGRRLPLARDDGLDRHGADLGVPRFGEQLTIAHGQLQVTAQREADADYRRRLAIYRPLTVPTQRTALASANGPGGPGDPASGLLSGLGPAPRIGLTDASGPFAVSVHLLSVGPDRPRQNLLQFLTAGYLVDPATTVPLTRRMPSALRTLQNQMRSRLSARFTFPPQTELAPSLALALDTLGRVRAALGEAAPWTVTLPTAGAPASRYELPLGIDLALPPAAELDRLRSALLAPDRQPAADPATEGVLAGLAATLRASPPGAYSSANDAVGSWLMSGCGLLTAQRTAAGVYVSPLPVRGLVVDAPTTVPAPAAVTIRARYLAPGDAPGNAALVNGLTAVVNGWRGPGNAVLTAVSAAGFGTSVQPLQPAIGSVLQATGFLTAAQMLQLGDATSLPGQVNAALALPVDYVRWVQLPAGIAAALAGTDAAAKAAAQSALTDLRNRLQAATLGAALPLNINGNVMLGIAVVPLPIVGRNVTPRRAFGFRWDVVPLTPLPAGAVSSVNTTNYVTTFTPPAAGLYALVATGYVRPSGPDPYEVRVDVPGATTLNFPQYELLLNLLAHCRALGVSIDTEPLRWAHVAGTGVTPPLPTTIATGYRPYRSRRFRGEVGIPVELVSSLPVIASITPTEVQQGAITPVVVSGTRLAGASAITVSGTGVTGTVTSQTDTDVQVSLTVTSDAALTARTFSLLTAAGTANSGDTNISLQVGPRPLIRTVTPNHLQQGQSGVTVTFDGQGLAGALNLQFSGTGLTVTNLSSTDSRITATVDVAAAASLSARTFTVSTLRGAADTRTLSMTVDPRPLVTSISPTTLEQGRTTAVTMNGQGLAGATAAGTSFGPDVSIQSFTAADAQVTATLVLTPAAQTTTRTPAMTTTRGAADFGILTVTVAPRPLVTSISPTLIQQGSTNVPVTCKGQALGAVTSASFSGTGLTATITSATAEAVTLSVTAAASALVGGRGLSLTMTGDAVDTTGMTLTVDPRPIVSSISPNQLRQATTTTVTLKGQGLTGASGLNAGTSITVSGLQVVDDQTVTASLAVDRLATVGTRSFSLNTQRGAADMSGLLLTVTPQPRLSSVSPSSADQGTSVSVTFDGQALDNPVNLSLGAGITVSNLVSGGSGSFTARLAIGGLATAGDRTPTLTAGGQSVDSNNVVFTVTVPKGIEKFGTYEKFRAGAEKDHETPTRFLTGGQDDAPDGTERILIPEADRPDPTPGQ